MYIFGNAPELAAGSKIWASVLKEMNDSDCLGKGLPMACHQHPDYVQIVEQPGQLKTVSPDGETSFLANTLSHRHYQIHSISLQEGALNLASLLYRAGTNALIKCGLSLAFEF